jgi:hypothetical protein
MNILGFDYHLSADEDESKLGVYGRTLFIPQEIQIAANLSAQQKVSTTLHEVLHVINETMRLDLTENTICRLETGLFQALSENGVDLFPLIDEIQGS